MHVPLNNHLKWNTFAFKGKENAMSSTSAGHWQLQQWRPCGTVLLHLKEPWQPYFGSHAIYVTSNDPELVVLPAPRNPTRSTANLTGSFCGSTACSPWAAEFEFLFGLNVNALSGFDFCKNRIRSFQFFSPYKFYTMHEGNVLYQVRMTFLYMQAALLKFTSNIRGNRWKNELHDAYVLPD